MVEEDKIEEGKTFKYYIGSEKVGRTYNIPSKKDLDYAFHDIKRRHFLSHETTTLFQNSYFMYKGEKFSIESSFFEAIPLQNDSLKELKVYFPPQQCTIFSFSNEYILY